MMAYVPVLKGQDVCSDTSRFCITTAFTPNGDGVNDVWFIQQLETYPGTMVRVFNTAGKEVFESMSYNNDWSGADSGGEQLPAGPYLYVVVQGVTGKQFSGTLLIIHARE